MPLTKSIVTVKRFSTSSLQAGILDVQESLGEVW